MKAWLSWSGRAGVTVNSWPLWPGESSQVAGRPATATDSMMWPSVSRLKAEMSWVALALIFTTAVKS